jgi:hypothetical protein
MATLLAEYRKRHKKNFVSTTNEGVCFFDVNDLPALICLTSLSTRSCTTCTRCTERPCSMIVELFQPTVGTYYQSYHGHCEPDSDIVKLIEKFGIKEAKPFMPNTQRDLEIWLWRFFVSSGRVRLHASKRESIKELQTLEEMATVAMRYPKSFSTYYSMFETFLLGRKYLMFGGKL